MQLLKCAIISLILISTYRSDGQQIEMGSGDIDFLHLPFNQEFIRRNNIDVIRVEEQLKRSNQSIRPTGLIKEYLFDDDGRCTSRASYRDRFGRTDTIFETYRLSPSDNIIQYDRKDRGGYYRETFDQIGDTLKICSFKGRKKDTLTTWMSCEKQVKSISSSGEQVTTLNENGLPYLKKSMEYDSNGYLVRMVELYVVSKKQRVTNYTYNEHGRLHFRRRESNDELEEWSYLYDNVEGGLSEVFYRVNSILIWRRAIVPDDYGRIAAILTKDQATDDILIEKFSYELETSNVD